MARILMVAPYPPARDGIASYAVQAVARLRAEGHDVEVLSPGPSAAHHHLDLVGPRGPLALAKRVRAYDKVVIQFHPDLFYPQPFADRPWAATSYALAAVFRLAHDLDIVVHETDYARGRMEGTLARAVRFMWQAAPSVTVHTEEERRSFSEAFRVPLERVHVAPHGAHFQRRTAVDRQAARQSLGIPADAFQFLAIGFVQPHKGFDRALRAFGRLADPGRARLDVVGSVRLDEPGYLDHADELRALADATPGAHLHLGYVSDEEFDRWLVAADVVVLPYRHIWSSGVIERAALYDRPVIVSRVGGLPTQARADTVLFDTDDELADAMAAAAGITKPAASPWPVDRDGVMAAVKERAALVRGPMVGARARSRQLPPFVPPQPTSARPGVGLLKRAQRRLTAWQLDPIVAQLERLREAVLLPDLVRPVVGAADEDVEPPHAP